MNNFNTEGTSTASRSPGNLLYDDSSSRSSVASSEDLKLRHTINREIVTVLRLGARNMSRVAMTTGGWTGNGIYRRFTPGI